MWRHDAALSARDVNGESVQARPTPAKAVDSAKPEWPLCHEMAYKGDGLAFDPAAKAFIGCLVARALDGLA
jgi:hypothetical protein